MEEQIQPKKRRTYWKETCILLIIILVCFGVYKGGYYLLEKYTQIAYTQGQLSIISGISQTGSIPFFDNSTGTVQVVTKNIKDICGVK